MVKPSNSSLLRPYSSPWMFSGIRGSHDWQSRLTVTAAITSAPSATYLTFHVADIAMLLLALDMEWGHHKHQGSRLRQPVPAYQHMLRYLPKVGTMSSTCLSNTLTFVGTNIIVDGVSCAGHGRKPLDRPCSGVSGETYDV